ncbi:MAG: hypothetical protein AAF682_09630 [Planctomycetota bacterium]
MRTLPTLSNARPTRLLPLLLSFATSAVPWAQATATEELDPLRRELVPLARKAGASYEIWALSPATLQKTKVLAGATFLPIELVGYPAKDRLRVDLPLQGGAGSPTPHVALPGGGAVYRLELGGATALLLVRRLGAPELLLSVTDGPGGEPGLLAGVHVAPDGARLIAASPPAAGGDVFAVDLEPAGTSVCLTSTLEPLDVVGASLRVSPAACWFVAGGVLQRAAFAPGVVPLAIEPGLAGTALPELVLATGGGGVVFTLEDAGGQRALLLDRADGGVQPVSFGYGDYSPPALDHPLGPWVAVSPDASLVAFREEVGPDHELRVTRVGTGEPPAELTESGTFANYIDSIGVLAFGFPEVLCFFAGDTHAGGDFVQDDELRAADMYAIDLASFAAPGLSNVTRTSGEKYPPFAANGTLAFDEALVGPLGDCFLLLGDSDAGDRELSSFLVDGGEQSYLPNHELLLPALSAAPTLVGSTGGLLVQATEGEPDPPYAQDSAEVDCSGVALPDGPVRIVGSNKSDAFAHDAKVWFDGTVSPGGTFTLDATAEGAHEIAHDTYLHVLDATDQVLQTVKFHTSCSEPLLIGDRFGASTLVDFTGEYEPTSGETDLCMEYSGDPIGLTMRYVGGGCGVMSHEQGSKVKCSGVPDAPWIHLRATNKSNPTHPNANVWCEVIVHVGDTFVLDAEEAGEYKLGKDTHLHAFDDQGDLLGSVKFHTSCSEPLVLGDLYGGFELVGGALESGAAAGDACKYGDPRELEFVYTGDGCEPLASGPRVRAAGPGGDQAVLALELAAGASVERYAASAGGGLAFVAVDPGGEERLYLLDVPTATAVEVASSAAFSATLAFAPGGRLFYTQETQGGQSELIQLLPGGYAFSLGVWADDVLPLAY